jgi:hypothetical protein
MVPAPQKSGLWGNFDRWVKLSFYSAHQFVQFKSVHYLPQLDPKNLVFYCVAEELVQAAGCLCVTSVRVLLPICWGEPSSSSPVLLTELGSSSSPPLLLLQFAYCPPLHKSGQASFKRMCVVVLAAAVDDEL